MVAGLFIDLGDLFTKGVAVGPGRRRRLRYPSVVAHRLLAQPNEPTELLIDHAEPLPRPSDFDPTRYHRTRSYPGAEAALRDFQGQGAVLGARYAGWQAATYGAARQVLGTHPTRENIDTLVHKALILGRTAFGSEVEVVFVVDSGAKAEAILDYARQLRRKVAFEVRSVRNAKPRRVELALRGRVVDAADCAVRVLPPDLDPRPVLLLDIGYFRSQLSIVSGEGCDYQEQLDGLGVSQCVRRILRDEQERGLVEDEFAVIRALERSAESRLEVAGREFEVGRSLARARESLGQELEHAARRVVLDYYGRRGQTCRALAIIGGGSRLAGSDLAARLGRAELGLGVQWVTADPSFFLLAGAEKAYLQS
jgi:hypothetical protein